MSTFKQWMVSWGFSEPEAVTPEDPLLTLAKTLTARQDAQWPERDGECKRAAVYAQMTNSYPERSKRDVSRAIEEALQCGGS